MSTRKAKLFPETQATPAPVSGKFCAFNNCATFPVWSPMVNGSVWRCRQHAGLPEPAAQRAPCDAPAAAIDIAAAKAHIAQFIRGAVSILEPPGNEWACVLRSREERGEQLMLVQQWAWRRALGEPIAEPEQDAGQDAEQDAEVLAERAAIQAEGKP